MRKRELTRKRGDFMMTREQITYDPASMEADAFIKHKEILNCLAWADAHRDDVALIDQTL